MMAEGDELKSNVKHGEVSLAPHGALVLIKPSSPFLRPLRSAGTP
jgi:hypothetical protein